MSDRASDQGVIDVAALLGQLEELEDGTLEPTRVDALMARLNESRAARQLYLDYFEDSATLRDIARTLDAQGKMPVAGNALASRRILRRSVLAAAALVALSGIIAALIEIRRPEAPVVSSAAVAGTQWTVDGRARKSTEGSLIVQPGTTVQVATGSVRLKQESGSTLVIQGPAEVSFPSFDRPDLRSGWLWIDSGDDNEAFAVHTPRFVVRDIGTRFGVRVPVEGPMEVHLIEGRVEVAGKAGSRRISGLSPTGAAMAFSAEQDPQDLPLAPDPFPGLPGLLGDPAGYRTTVLGQAPVGYWALNHSDGRDLANEVPGASTGFRGMAVRLGEPGVDHHDERSGFAKSNRSLYLDGSPDQSVVAGIDGPRGVLRREGSASFWIRRPSEAARRDEILWLAGSSSTKFSVPDRAMIHTRLTRAGHLEFVVDDNGAAAQVASSRNIADGQWHHVIATWGPSAVDLYVDGRPAASAARPDQVREGSFSGRYVRFGKPSLDLVGRFHPFTGWVDEIALWNRPLTPAEARHQFESALGSPID